MNQMLWFLLECTAKSSVVIAAAWVLAAALKRRSASIRHMVWSFAVLSLFAMPVLTRLVKSVPQPALIAGAGNVVAAGVRTLTTGTDGAPMIVQAVMAPSATAAQLAIIAWAAVAAGFMLMLIAGMGRLWWLSLRAQPVYESEWLRMCSRPVRLLLSKDLQMPVTWGWLHPEVILPVEAQQWSTERLGVVLAHETAHVARGDWPMQLAAEIGRAFYWFNPLVWIGSNGLRRQSERACDDAVLRMGVEGPDYAEHLLALARATKGREWSAALAMARRTNLERRFEAMLDQTMNRSGAGAGVRMLAAAAAVAVMLPLAALNSPAQTQSGKFSGTVYDVSKAVVPNATVIAVNPTAKTKDMTTSNAAGFYEFKSLPAGSYNVIVLAPGFARFEKQEVKLEPNFDFMLPVTLQLGQVSETITVSAEGPPKGVPVAAGEPQRLRVGGNVQATKIIKRVPPVYPQAAKMNGIQGTVMMEAVISREGSLMSLRVLNSQIDPDLARSAVEAVSQWQYQPTLLNGEPVEIITQIQVNYTLTK